MEGKELGSQLAKEFTRDCQEAAVTDTFKQAEIYFVCRHRKLLQSIESWHICVRNLLSTIAVYSFVCFCFVGLFSLFVKALLAIAVRFLVSSQVPTLVIECHHGACYGS